MSMLPCPKCKDPVNTEENVFCPNCGTPVGLPPVPAFIPSQGPQTPPEPPAAVPPAGGNPTQQIPVQERPAIMPQPQYCCPPNGMPAAPQQDWRGNPQPAYLNQPVYYQPVYYQQAPAPKRASNGPAITGLVFGAVSLFMTLMAVALTLGDWNRTANFFSLCIALAIPGEVLGIVSVCRRTPKKLLGILALVFAAAAHFVCFSANFISRF